MIADNLISRSVRAGAFQYGMCLILFVSNLATADSANFTAEERNHWAFQPVRHAVVPVVTSETNNRPSNPVDAFVLTDLQKSDRGFLPPADRLTLLRRLTLDLIGLPPTPAETVDFLADDSPDALERLVDRLLASPHYGEAWGRMWLDVVRFAETAGFNADPARPLAYKYRDYVIRTFNGDVLYDRFLQEQIAGDELFPDSSDALAATGYCRMWADESNASNIHLARQQALTDLTGNLGAAILGLSIGCAQCHDHKFDPIRQTDFYQLQAFFSGIVLEDSMPVGSHDELAEYYARRQKWLDETAELRHELHAIEHEARRTQSVARRMKFPSDVLDAIDCLPEERNTMQRQLAFWTERQMDYKNDELPKLLTDEARLRRDELLEELAIAKKSIPKPVRESSLMAVAELSQTPPKTYRLANGSYDKPQEELSPHFPVILRTSETQNPPTIVPPSGRSSGQRSVLAKWLTNANHPLTYRVWVNRIWQGHFAKGMVENANDFGMLTPKPVHPELLDWLTTEFISAGFGTKRLHRQIVLSSAYQQQASAAPPGAGFDNWCYPRHRMTAERIRDGWLTASGQLNDTMYGPGVRPELPPNFGGSANWKVSEAPDRNRRSVYIYAKRNLPYPLIAAFDFPDMHESCGCRTSTTIAPQALTLLNSDLVFSAARKFAARVGEDARSSDPTARIRHAWQVAFGSVPKPEQTAAGLQFIADQKKLITESVTKPPEISTNVSNDDKIDSEAFVDFCHALLNANQFLFVE